MTQLHKTALIFILLLGSLFDSSLFAQSDKRFEELKYQLISIHGTNWKSISQSFTGNENTLRQTLREIIAKPEKFFPNEANLQYLAKSNAISGYGIICKKDKTSNALDPSEINFYKDLLDHETDSTENFDNYKVSIFNSLKNTGTYDALKILYDESNKETDPYYLQTIYEQSSYLLQGQPKFETMGDLIYTTQYYPNLEKPFYEREQADWEDLILKLKGKPLLVLQSLPVELQNNAATAEIFTTIEKSFNKSLADLKNNKKGIVKTSLNQDNSHQSQRRNIASNGNDNTKNDFSKQLNSRELASANDSRSDQSGFNFNLVLKILAILVIIGGIYFYKKSSK